MQSHSRRKTAGRVPGNRDAKRERNTMMTKLGKRGWVGDISEDWVEYRQTDRK